MQKAAVSSIIRQSEESKRQAASGRLQAAGSKAAGSKVQAAGSRQKAEGRSQQKKGRPGGSSQQTADSIIRQQAAGSSRKLGEGSRQQSECSRTSWQRPGTDSKPCNIIIYLPA